MSRIAHGLIFVKICLHCFSRELYHFITMETPLAVDSTPVQGNEEVTTENEQLRRMDRLKAELALAHQKIADQDAELAKMDDSFNQMNMELIKRVQQLMKADKPQNMSYSNEMDQILIYVEKQKMHHKKWEWQRKLRLQRQLNLKKAMDPKTKMLTETVKNVGSD